MDPVGAAWWAGGRDSEEGCTQMALGTQGQWRQAPCAGRYPFICEQDVTGRTKVQHSALSVRNLSCSPMM